MATWIAAFGRLDEMKRSYLCVLAGMLGTASLQAQPPDPPAAFDVVSVKPRQALDPAGTMMQERAGSLFYRKINLLAVILRAYGVDPQQVVGPALLRTERYDIEAQFPAGTPDARFQLMLQKLLADRFHLEAHREKKELPAYTLVVAKDGFKMRRSETGALGYGPSRDATGRHLSGKITLPILAGVLSDAVGHPVTNATDLEGLYDINLNFTDDEQSQAPAAYPGIFTALQHQLGLKLESRKSMFDIIVIDRVEKVPTEN
jgi:uncharacterized protein (TIGR03435 family)